MHIRFARQGRFVEFSHGVEQGKDGDSDIDFSRRGVAAGIDQGGFTTQHIKQGTTSKGALLACKFQEFSGDVCLIAQ